jgi:hypothetical protein
VEISYDPDIKPVRAGLRTGGPVLICLGVPKSGKVCFLRLATVLEKTPVVTERVQRYRQRDKRSPEKIECGNKPMLKMLQK